jgi:hypothetical protein
VVLVPADFCLFVRRGRVVVILLNKVYVYNFADLSLLHHIDTVGNPRGTGLWGCGVARTSLLLWHIARFHACLCLCRIAEHGPRTGRHALANS